MRHRFHLAALKISVSGIALTCGAAAYAQPATVDANGQPPSPAEIKQAPPVAGQAGQPKSEGEIIVTAQKRAQRLQDVPLSVQAITPATLAKTGADTTQSLQKLVPGLNVSDNVSGFKPFIRGVGSATSAAGNENSVSTYVDNIYLASMNAGLLNLASIQSVEVLKGPQGTLFGRNATGGVVNIITKRPRHELSGTGTLRYGNYQTVTGSGYITGGLGTNLAADLAVYFRDQGKGYGTNLATGHEVNKGKSITLRSKFLFTPTDVDTFILAADYSHEKSSGNTYRPYDGSTVQWGGNNPALPFGGPSVFPARGGYWDVNMAIDPRYSQNVGGVSLTYEHDFGWASLSSFTAWRESKVDQAWNATPIAINAQYAGWRQPERQFSQEIQLSSLPSSRVAWIIGAYYLNAQVKYDPFFISGLALAPNQQQFQMTQSIKSPAIYGQATIPLTASKDTNLTVGARYTIDKRAIVGEIDIVRQPAVPGYVPHPAPILAVVNPTNASKTWKTPTWRISLDHRFSPQTMVYVSYNRGFKAGSYNSIPPGGPTTRPTNPEYLDAYEAGIKNTLFGGTVTANASAFLYNYKDLQVTIFNQTSAQTVNAAKARIKGIDLELTARPIPELRMWVNAEFLDHKFVSYPNGPILTPLTLAQGGGLIRTFGDLSGKPLPYTANTSIVTGADLNVPTSVGTFDATANFSYNSGYSFEPSNVVGRHSFVDISGSTGLTLQNNRTRLFLYGKNLTNEHAPKILTTGGNPGGYIEVQYRPPREFGVGITQDF